MENTTREELLKVAKPAFFNGEMVKAILDGKKTQTRRIIKPQPKPYDERDIGPYVAMDDGSFEMVLKRYKNISDYPVYPKYHKGDILYVPECQSIERQLMVFPEDVETVKVVYKADGDVRYIRISQKEWERLAKYDDLAPKFLSPYWTTKETARLFLRITDVRVERLQEISDVDTVKEGIRTDACICRLDDPEFMENIGGREEFQNLWDSTVKKADLDRFGWDANPWVFVYSFEKN